jgi:DNA-binding response OmpR family regulator
MHVLVVEDERKTAALIRKALLDEGFEVDVLHNGDEILPFVASRALDVVVLDIMLPGTDGLDAVRQMRKRGLAVPVILLSARGEVDERVAGLEAGADDYLPKPFILSELIARIRALARRTGGPPPSVISVADLVLKSATREVMRAHRPIELTNREYLLLEHLLRAAGRACTRTSIMEKVWGFTFDPGTNLVDVYIKRLREKVDAGYPVKLLSTVRGVGYALRDPDQPSTP